LLCFCHDLHLCGLLYYHLHFCGWLYLHLNNVFPCVHLHYLCFHKSYSSNFSMNTRSTNVPSVLSALLHANVFYFYAKIQIQIF
jgi:hypothetical protein